MFQTSLLSLSIILGDVIRKTVPELLGGLKKKGKKNRKQEMKSLFQLIFPRVDLPHLPLDCTFLLPKSVSYF